MELVAIVGTVVILIVIAGGLFPRRKAAIDSRGKGSAGGKDRLR